MTETVTATFHYTWVPGVALVVCCSVSVLLAARYSVLWHRKPRPVWTLRLIHATIMLAWLVLGCGGCLVPVACATVERSQVTDNSKP